MKKIYEIRHSTMFGIQTIVAVGLFMLMALFSLAVLIIGFKMINRLNRMGIFPFSTQDIAQVFDNLPNFWRGVLICIVLLLLYLIGNSIYNRIFLKRISFEEIDAGHFTITIDNKRFEYHKSDIQSVKLRIHRAESDNLNNGEVIAKIAGVTHRFVSQYSNEDLKEIYKKLDQWKRDALSDY